MPDYFDTGFCVRQPSWHGKETLLQEYPKTWAEARPLAGLDWDYQVGPMFDRREVSEPAVVDGEPVMITSHEYLEVPKFQVVRRSDTLEVLAVERQSYEVISIAEMGEIVEALTDAREVEFETAGSVRDGRTVWALVRLGGGVTIGKDPSPTQPYLGLVNHCDKAGACRAFQTGIRMVCWNTVSAAEAQAQEDNTVATFRHTSNWRDHLQAARDAILGARHKFDQWVELAEHMQELTVTDAQAENFVREFMPYPMRQEGDNKVVTDRVANNIEIARRQLRTVLHESRTSEGIQGTGYWLFQGATEYLDHLREAKNQQSYVARTVVETNKGKALAYKLVKNLVGV